jgi:anthranilate phosphoribosyltransferase
VQTWIERVADGQTLSAGEAEQAFGQIMRGEASPVEIAAFLSALRTRGETPREVAGGVQALRRVMVEVPLPEEGLVDTCGTGGGSLTTFNISTVAALVAAGGGVGVAKHGNRSFSSRCGSADVLETLGVAIELGPEGLGELYDEVGFVFMFAPRFHPAMGEVAPVRRELGMSTIMNLLGPLTSPARVRRQVVGVATADLLDLIAGALAELGHERALVVHGEPGLDELSPLGPTRGVRLEGGRIERFEVRPEDFGWSGLDAGDLAGGTPEENARIAREVLQGDRRGAARAAVVLNAAAAFYVAGRCDDLEAGGELARTSLDSGAALDTLERLRETSRRLADREAGA